MKKVAILSCLGLSLLSAVYGFGKHDQDKLYSSGIPYSRVHVFSDEIIKQVCALKEQDFILLKDAVNLLFQKNMKSEVSIEIKASEVFPGFKIFGREEEVKLQNSLKVLLSLVSQKLEDFTYIHIMKPLLDIPDDDEIDSKARSQIIPAMTLSVFVQFLEGCRVGNLDSLALRQRKCVYEDIFPEKVTVERGEFDKIIRARRDPCIAFEALLSAMLGNSKIKQANFAEKYLEEVLLLDKISPNLFKGLDHTLKLPLDDSIVKKTTEEDEDDDGYEDKVLFKRVDDDEKEKISYQENGKLLLDIFAFTETGEPKLREPEKPIYLWGKNADNPISKGLLQLLNAIIDDVTDEVYDALCAILSIPQEKKVELFYTVMEQFTVTHMKDLLDSARSGTFTNTVKKLRAQYKCPIGSPESEHAIKEIETAMKFISVMLDAYTSLYMNHDFISKEKTLENVDAYITAIELASNLDIGSTIEFFKKLKDKSI